MTRERLIELLERMAAQRLLVIGDYFVDLYLDIDRSVAETSIETGLEAHQVVTRRVSPGAAGNVAANVRALGARVVALGPIGDDGNGYDLRRALTLLDIDPSQLVSNDALMTPTYTKPMLHEVDGRIHELSRLDIKNRRPLPADVEQAILDRLAALADAVDGIIVNDQVPEANHGAITDRVREALMALGQARPELPITVDSRERVGLYRHLILKPNERETRVALGWADDGATDVRQAAQALAAQTGRPVFCTLGAEGCLVCTAEGAERVPAVPVEGEIDIVGAGDTTLAALTTALCAGATPLEAALLGNLAASVTIRCLGTTGTASPEAILRAYDDWQATA